MKKFIDCSSEEECLTLFKEFFDMSPFPVSISEITAEDEPLAYINPAFTDLTGYSFEEIVGYNCRMLQGITNDQPASEQLRRAIQRGETGQAELLNYRKDGSSFWNFVRIMPIETNCTDKKYVLGFQVDVTAVVNPPLALEYVTLRTEMEKSRRASQIHTSRHAVMGEMIGMISHQWRQPLALSMLNVEILTKKIEMVAGINEADKHFLLERLSLLRDMVQEQSCLITDFTDFFKPEREKQSIQVASSIDTVLKMFESNFSTYNIALTANIPDTANLFGYEREFRQVIINIIKNAIDQLVEHEIANPKIHIEVEEQCKHIIITIHDNGGGISADVLPSVFNAYVSSKSLNGTGLGLYMVKLIIVEHFEGDVIAYNSKDGAVFRILLPVQN